MQGSLPSRVVTHFGLAAAGISPAWAALKGGATPRPRGPAHHYKITAPGRQPLITQLYFATDPVFEGDPDKNYVKDPILDSRELIRPVTVHPAPEKIRAAVDFEIVLERL